MSKVKKDIKNLQHRVGELEDSAQADYADHVEDNLILSKRVTLLEGDTEVDYIAAYVLYQKRVHDLESRLESLSLELRMALERITKLEARGAFVWRY